MLVFCPFSNSRCIQRESIHLKSDWVMVTMDQLTRRIMGFAVYLGQISGMDLCCLFNKMISDNDPLFQFYRWQANLGILGIEEIKTVSHPPFSHPFVERLIGAIRQEHNFILNYQSK
jgi:putative transposase